jgi:hypothetical protein
MVVTSEHMYCKIFGVIPKVRYFGNLIIRSLILDMIFIVYFVTKIEF